MSGPVTDCMRQLQVVYRERARLVALLASQYPSLLAPASVAEPGFGWVVFVNLPTGQASWHIADDDLGLFPHVHRTTMPSLELWDGHDTPEKYRRIEKLARLSVVTRAESGRGGDREVGLG